MRLPRLEFGSVSAPHTYPLQRVAQPGRGRLVDVGMGEGVISDLVSLREGATNQGRRLGRVHPQADVAPRTGPRVSD